MIDYLGLLVGTIRHIWEYGEGGWTSAGHGGIPGAWDVRHDCTGHQCLGELTMIKDIVKF